MEITVLNEQITLHTNNEKVSVKMNITRISKHLPRLIFDEIEVEDVK